jgi:AraC family transcriptional regulator of adaptative response / methylphosphotriester-DNA alkyltransferase methyltransferase
MSIPSKILTRKDQITADFFKMLDEHINDVLSGKIDYTYRIKDFAALLFIHPTHFSNTIKLTTGKSPCDFAEARITAEAKKMLGESAMPVSEICYRLTFKDPTNFTKFFKTMTGQTPTQYRKSLIEKNSTVYL